jgi:hypothetical protein
MRSIKAAMLAAAITSAANAGEISCNSISGELNRCALPDANKMKVKLKLDREGACQKGDTWGVDSDGVWVDMGCRAVFTYKDPHARPWWRSLLPKPGR